MSRSLLRTGFAALILLLATGPADAKRRTVAHRPPPFNVAFTEGGYADQTSVRQGGSIRLHIASSVTPLNVQIVNLAAPQNVLRTRTVSSSAQNCSGRAAQGCGWSAPITLDIPTSWPSGYYAARFPTAFGERNIIFVVRAANPGRASNIVLISPTNTYQAFNEFAGGSFFPSDDPTRANEVSFDRPYSQEAGLGRFPIWEKPLVDWLTKEGRPFEVLTDTDLEDPTALARYDVAVLVGHAEYWTAAARANLEQFSRSGGHVVILGGNTMWWQVRLINNNRSMLGFKSQAARFDISPDASLITTNWYSPPVSNPENRIVGASFRNGGVINGEPVPGAPGRYVLKPVEQRLPWTVTDASSWVFSGTGLSNGSTFGRETAGLEGDGVVFNCSSSGAILGPDGSDEAPRNYHILATVPGTGGWATMGYYVNQAGGVVFNAASQNWVFGLWDNPTVQRITRNVLDRLGSGAPLPYDPSTSPILAQDLFNCVHPTFTLTGWETDKARGATTSACAYEGPRGFELSGSEPIAVARGFGADGQGRNHAELRFYINADAAAQRTNFPMPIVTLRQRSGFNSSQVAVVELDASGNNRRIRVARIGPDGFAPAPEWINLSSGWHLVEVTWRSPGTIEIQVDGGSRATLNNPHSGQTANEVVLGIPAAEISAAGRVCIDALAVATERLGGVPALR